MNKWKIIFWIAVAWQLIALSVLTVATFRSNWIPYVDAHTVFSYALMALFWGALLMNWTAKH